MRRRASGRIEKEVSGGSADSEERRKKREKGPQQSGRERENERTRDVEGDGGGD